MPYRNPDPKTTVDMITIFIVLGVVLLVIPVTCIIFAIHARTQQKKRAEIIKYATATRTTVQQGPNGRTVFEAKAVRPSPKRSTSRKQSPPRSPILPFSQQQANKISRPKSVKGAWQRLSRPFSSAPALVQDDEIELTRNAKPVPFSTRDKDYSQNDYDGPVSPMSEPRSAVMASSSSWRTVNDLESRTPVSPMSVTNLPPSSSITGTIIRGYQPGHNPHMSQHFQGVQQRSESMDDVPLTPPAQQQQRLGKKKTRRGKLDYGASRGFMPPSAMTGAGAGSRYALDEIKTNVVDANRHEVNNVRLAQPPKARVNRR